jgi:hypothetical protein
MKMFKNSTHDVDKVFGQVALTSSYISHLRVVIESSYGERTIGKHTEKSVLRDIFSLAYFLYHDILRAELTLLTQNVTLINGYEPNTFLKR